MDGIDLEPSKQERPQPVKQLEFVALQSAAVIPQIQAIAPAIE
jgi:hypothetical protein